jgi:excisionase family DNA binding protein
MNIETRDEQVRRIHQHGVAMTQASFARELAIAEQRGAAAALSSKYLTVDEACALLKCCRKSIYNYFRSGKLTYVRSPGGLRLIAASDLLLVDKAA